MTARITTDHDIVDYHEVSMEDVHLLWEADRDPYVEIEGVQRRLAATVDSMSNRRDGQTDLYTGEPQLSTPPDWVYTQTAGRGFRSRSIPLVWESGEGCWSSRAWRLRTWLNVSVDIDYGDTFMTLMEPTLAVIGRTGSTIFWGQNLSPLIVPALQRRMARQWAREITGAYLDEVEGVDFAEVWDQSPEDWVRPSSWAAQRSSNDD